MIFYSQNLIKNRRKRRLHMFHAHPHFNGVWDKDPVESQRYPLTKDWHSAMNSIIFTLSLLLLSWSQWFTKWLGLIPFTKNHQHGIYRGIHLQTYFKEVSRCNAFFRGILTHFSRLLDTVFVYTVCILGIARMRGYIFSTIGLGNLNKMFIYKLKNGTHFFNIC